MGGAPGAVTSNRTDSGVGTNGGVHDAGIAGQAGGVPDSAAPTEGGARTTTSAFTQISSGGLSTCGLRADGTVACWGNNTYGESAPVAATFTQISTGGIHN